MAGQTDAPNGKGVGRGQIQMDRHPDLLVHRTDKQGHRTNGQTPGPTGAQDRQTRGTGRMDRQAGRHLPDYKSAGSSWGHS